MIAHEPGPGHVIRWQQQLNPGGKIYDFIALHVAGRGWYTTALNQWHPVSWPQLREFIGDCPAWVAVSWQPLGHDQFSHHRPGLSGRPDGSDGAYA